VFAAKYQLKRVTVAILNCASFHSFYCLMSRKGKSFKQTNSVSIGIIKCFAVSEVTVCVRMQSFGIDTSPQSFCYSFVALAVDDYVVQSQPRNQLFRCQLAVVVMETTANPICKMKITIINGELNKASLY